MLNQQVVQDAIEGMPSLPVALIGALDIINQEPFELSELIAMVSNDPILASRVLTVANSPFYGMVGEIASLREAFMVLGTHTIRSILLATAAMNSFPSQNMSNLDLIQLWKHSVGVAVAAKILASSTDINTDSALTSGLLFNIGKMLLDACFPDAYGQVISYRDEHDCLLVEAETAILGVDHSMAGALLAKHWRLPDSVVAPIRYHYDCTKGGQHSPMVCLVYVADVISRGLEIGDSGDTLIPPLTENVLDVLNLNMANIEDTLPEISQLAVTSFDSLKV
jgi:HD-like signal output (HDOD) protein